MVSGSILQPRRALLHAEFAALPGRAGTSQVALAGLAGVTVRQANNRARGCAALPRWAALLAVVLTNATAEAPVLLLGDTQLSCDQVLDVPHSAQEHRDRARLPALARPLAQQRHQRGIRDEDRQARTPTSSPSKPKKTA